jgi:hypothetical protein
MSVRHLVLLRFKSSTSPQARADCLAAFAQLPQQIPGISAFEQGGNMSAEGLNKGFDHATLITFVDVAARDAYLPHPAHLAFVDSLKPLIDDVLVLDYLQ